MDEQITDQQALMAVTDPNTPGAVLQGIAAQHPELWPQIAAHPQAYPGLLDWLDGHGDASVRYIVAARRAGIAAPTTALASPAPAAAPPVTTAPVLAPQTMSQPAPKRGDSKKALIIVLCVVLVAVIGVGAYLLFGKGSGPNVKITPGAKAYGGTGDDTFNSVAVAPDGSIIAVGYTSSTDGDFPATKGGADAVVAKIGPDGALVWAKTIGGSRDDVFNSIAVNPDGSIIAAGGTSSTDGDFEAKSGGSDAVIAKVGSNGNIAWIKTYSGNGFNSVAVAADGSIFAVGGGAEATAARIGSDGTVVWEKNYGGSDRDEFNSVAVAADGNIIVAGDTSSIDGDFPASKGGQDTVVANINPDGSLAWAKTYGGSGYDWFSSVAVASDGSIVTVGGTESVDGDFPDIHDINATEEGDAVVARLTADGNLAWAKTYGGNGNDSFASGATTSGGSIIAVGHTDSTDGDFPNDADSHRAVVANINPDGAIAWAKTYGSGEAYLEAVAVAQYGIIVTVGDTYSADGDFPDVHDGDFTQNGDAVVARLTADGSLS